MEESEDVGVDTERLKELLELQLSEVEMLQSMFCNAGEFELDDPTSVPEIQSFMDGIIQYEYLQSSIGFTVKITLDDDKVGTYSVSGGEGGGGILSSMNTFKAV